MANCFAQVRRAGIKFFLWWGRVSLKGAHMGGLAKRPLSNLIKNYAREYQRLRHSKASALNVNFLIAWDFPGSYIPRSFYNHLRALEEATQAHRIQKSVLIAPDLAAAMLVKKVVEKFGGEVYLAPLMDRNLMLTLSKLNQRELLRLLEELRI